MAAERHAIADTPARVPADRRSWIAVVVLCLGQLMLTLDATVANVALPAIQRDLRFSQSSLAWVVNGYLITFGGALLLAGRLGDLLGRRNVFLAGLALFTAASLLCGLATSQGLLIGARGLQGLAAAGDSAMILAILVTIFSDPRDTAKAVGIYTFVAVSGGTIGLLVGGALTQALNWHWIFFINIPIGVATLVLGALLIPDHQGIGIRHGVDVLGALLVTATPGLVVYTIIQASDNGWHSTRTLSLGGAALVMAVSFVLIEARSSNPLVPLRIFRSRTVIGANLVRACLAFGMFGLFFLGALYLQRVLGYGALETGFAFLPLTLVVAVFSLFITRRVVARLGARATLVAGAGLSAAGNLLLAHASVGSSYDVAVLPAFLLVGAGGGLAFMPTITLAMAGAGPGDSGLVSGLANVSSQMGAALGVAVLASIATTRTTALLAHGRVANQALTGGYDLGLVVAGGCVASAIVVAATLLRVNPERPAMAAAVARLADTSDAA
ncbi:MAG TPA: MFS transporter [Chloroflexota bacterium]|nr:MFS transporter [Chloroflexota bacterium]